MQSRIAIVGVSVLFPGSRDAESFWSNIVAGKDMMADVPSTHWRVDDYYDADPQAPDKTYSRRGAFMPPVQFDALAFGIPPSSLPAIDTAQLLALMTAEALLADAAQGGTLKIDRERIGVILGVTSGTELLGHMAGRLQRPLWQKGLRDLGFADDVVQSACNSIAAQFVPWQENTFPGLLGNVVAGRIANRLDLGGTNCVVDAACASSLSAISMAINELTLRQADLVIAGGVDAANDPTTYMCFSKTPALSRTGDCRPFSNDADGTMVGEGMAMFALRRLEDAERDGDAIYGVLAGLGLSSDGRSKSVYAPLSAGQAKALRRTYAQAGYGPETVELLEAHGTGTKAGDTAEFKALREVFSDAAVQRRQGAWCALGSVKSQIGHTKAAAGAAGLFKALMALHHRVLPPTVKVNKPNADLEIEHSPFYLNTEARPWISNGLHPRRASLSAFGFGGSNFHVTLEEYCGSAIRPKRFRSHPAELLLFSGSSCADLMERCRIARDEALGGASMGRLARSSRDTFQSDALARLVLVATNESSLPSMLARALERLQTEPEQTADAHVQFQRSMTEGHTAFLRTVEALCASIAGPLMPSSLHQDEPIETARPDQSSSSQDSLERTKASPKPRSEMPAATPSVSPLTISAVPPATPKKPAADMSARFFPKDASPQPSAQTMQPPPMRTPAQPTGRSAPDSGAAHAVFPPVTANTQVRAHLQAKLFAVIAEKTGYPAEVLDPNMDMEADLGIDSIKRVEILSSFDQAAPGLLEITAAEVAGLRTLAEIIDRIASAAIDRRSL